MADFGRYYRQALPDPDADLRGYGPVMYYFDSEPINGRKPNVSALVYFSKKLYVLPSYVYNQAYIRSVIPNITKSQLCKRQVRAGTGEWIHYKLERNTNLVESFEHSFVGESPDSKEHPIFMNESKEEDMVTEIYVQCYIDEDRRLYTFSSPFNDDDMINAIIPAKALENFPLHVPLVCLMTVKIDLHGWKQLMPLRRLQPTFTMQFVRFICVEKPTDQLLETIWERSSVATRPSENIPSWYPASILPYSPHNKYITSECLIVNNRELFSFCHPNNKCIPAFNYENDRNFVAGRVVGCEMFYCRINKAYVVYKFYWHPDWEEGDRKKFIPLGFHIENPMDVRHREGFTEFLTYVKLNDIGHYFCNYFCAMITDPRNILHGRVQLGEESPDSCEIEKVPGVGIQCWVRFLPDNHLFRLEISEVYDKRVAVKHRKFTTSGLCLNRRGTVYSPYVCNFPIQLMLKAEKVKKKNVEVGDWFRFKARFIEATQRYEIYKVLKVTARMLFPMVELTHEDTFAFHIPLDPLAWNFHWTRNLILSKGMGFIEDVYSDHVIFAAAWASMYPEPTENDQADPVTLAKCSGPMDVWCRENPDIAERKTVLCIAGMEKPEGI